jgi:iron-sulfur cluster repair protein YtfE (RIC family)
MPNVLDLLNHDHREVEELFAQFESTQDHRIALQICQELTVHTQVEEEIVYPVLERLDRRLEQEAEEEHDEAKQLIARIEAMTPDDPQLAPTMQELKSAVQHHVDEEESEAWPKMRSAAGNRLDDLGRQVEQRKQRLMGEVGEYGEAPAPLVESAAPSTNLDRPTEVRGRAATDLDEMTRDELYELAKDAGIEGRSKMKKAELKRALARR